MLKKTAIIALASLSLLSLLALIWSVLKHPAWARGGMGVMPAMLFPLFAAGALILAGRGLTAHRLMRRGATIIFASFTLLSLSALIWSALGGLSAWEGAPLQKRFVEVVVNQMWPWLPFYVAMLCWVLFTGREVKGIVPCPAGERLRSYRRRKAHVTIYPDLVQSPYLPYSTVDVSGIDHGVEVFDPVSHRIFINP